MNNEPVAYAMFKNDEFYDAIHPKQYTEHIGSYTIPLYTHPAKIEDEPNWKEMYWEMHELNHKHWSKINAHQADLTDEEIINIADTYDWHKDCAIEFARAILRKAQEK